MEERSGPSVGRGACPALLPAGALLGGVRLGLALPSVSTGAAVALALLGISLGPVGRGAGRLLAVAAAGLLLGGVAGERAWTPQPDRPVSAVAEVVGHWRWFGDAWSAPVRIVRVRQGIHTRRPDLEATLRLPGPEEPPVLGSRVRVRGHLRRAPPLGNDPPLPPGRWRLWAKSRLLVEVVREGGLTGRLASGMRSEVERALGAAGPPGAATAGRANPGESGLGRALVRALVLGDASGVPMTVRRGLRRTGLAHVLAVSGLHVGLVAGVALALGAWLPRRARLATALGAVALYVFVVGPRPALLRASVMACLAVGALLAERPPQAANALAVAAAGLVLARPTVLLDVGFQLTVGATAGIVLIGPALAARWLGGANGSSEGRSRGTRRGWRAGLVRSLAASVAAQLGVLPWALPVFSLLTPWAPVVNLVAVPWTAVALAGSLGWVGLAWCAPGVAAAVGGVLEVLAAPFAWPAAVAPRPWIALPMSTGFAGAAAMAVGLWAAVWWPWWRCRVAGIGRVGRVGIAAASLSALVVVAAGPGAGGPGVEAVMIDVGQGDAILLRDGPRAVLVDGGGWRHGDLGGRVLLPVLARRRIRNLDAVVVTHPDRDHCGGLVDIAGYLEVAGVVSGPGIGASPCGLELDSLPGLVRREVEQGEGLSVGRWRLRVLHPEATEAGRRSRRPSDNNASLVIVAEAFGRRLLLTGDLEEAGERRLVRKLGESLRSDVLKVAHHGSRSSTGASFLRSVSPRLALVSAGERNPYGHPAEQVLRRLAADRVRTLRTDRDGMIVLRIRPDGTLVVRLPGAPK